MTKKSLPAWIEELARDAASAVPAYGDFISKHGGAFKSFETLPVMTKKNYIEAYPLASRIAKGALPEHLHASSGSSGSPTFWYRDARQEEGGGALHERLFKEVLKIDRDTPTLALVCFSMGIWVAGGFTLSSLGAMQRRGWRLSVATPAMSEADILSVLEQSASADSPYERVVLFGYPPFLAGVLAEAKRRGHFKKQGAYAVVTGGSSISPKWREDMLDTINAARPSDVVNLYGSADASLMGFESEETLWLTKMAERSPALKDTLVPEGAPRYSLFTYDPEHIYFEELEGELLITLRAAVPLIRYNIHDRGRVLYGVPTARSRGELPLVVVTGRTDVALTFYAINMYPEHFEAALADPKVAKLSTGSYRAYTKETGKKHAESLHIDIECNAGIRPKAADAQAVAEALVRSLLRNSIEFRKLREVVGEAALPKVSLVPHGTLELKKQGTQTFHSLNGKKPKMLM